MAGPQAELDTRARVILEGLRRFKGSFDSAAVRPQGDRRSRAATLRPSSWRIACGGLGYYRAEAGAESVADAGGGPSPWIPDPSPSTGA